MKKKILLSTLLVVLLIAAFLAWQLFGASVKSPQKKYFYISTGEDLGSVKKHLIDSQIINGVTWFNLAAKIADLNTVKPGRYKIEKGTSITDLVRMLRNGTQTPVSLVITKLRTRESLAARIGKNFECDSLAFIRFIENGDSLKQYGMDSTTIMAMVMPYTYQINWTSQPSVIVEQFHKAWSRFWTDERKAKASAIGLTPIEVSTMASIIEEETNAASDKPYIASVYLNRINAGMPLQADPTLKYAMRAFSLRRLYNVHMTVESPYNTYQNRGLPPGPICTPSLATIDAVLNAPKTDYYYFVASPKFDGTHVFTRNLTEHGAQARLYRAELDKRNIR
jgi:UPF0755 protein